MVDHATHLKAVNHPIRRKLLETINESGKILKSKLIEKLKEENVIDDNSIFQYNVDFLRQAECVKEILENDETYYEILPAGKVIESF